MKTSKKRQSHGGAGRVAGRPGKQARARSSSKARDDVAARAPGEAAVVHSQTVGRGGPVLEQDGVLHETLQTFIHEKLLERPVHVKGFGAFGCFETTHSMAEHTKLSFLQRAGDRVPVAVRFSLAVSTKGTPDTARNVRGFSTKFYTREGVFDLLCNHIPVLFVRDGIRFPEAIHAFLPSPKDNLADPNSVWRFVARAPEAVHFMVWLYSDVGTVRSLRRMRGHSVSTYVWRNAAGERRYVKYHWLPLAGEEYLDRREAVRLAGESPDASGRDLHDAIAAGQPVEYQLCVQLMDPERADALPFDPLDDTKVWSEQQVPLLPVGRLILDRNPDDYTAQVEKLAFSPANLLDGAELSDDRLLQARANIYWDSQRRRLGPGFRQIPINRSASWSPEEIVTSGAGRSVAGTLVRAEIAEPDDFSQAGERYRALSAIEQEHLIDNLAVDLAVVDRDTLAVVIGHLSQASSELGERVARRIAIYEKR